MSAFTFLDRIHDPQLQSDPIVSGLLPIINDATNARIGWYDSHNPRLRQIFEQHASGLVRMSRPCEIRVNNLSDLFAFVTKARAHGDWPVAALEDIPVWLQSPNHKPDLIVNRNDLYPLGVISRGVHLICKTADGNYLLSRRSQKVATYKGCIDVSAGGFVSHGKSPEEALKTEALDEIGLDARYIQANIKANKPRTYEYIKRMSGFPIETNGGVGHDRVYSWTVVLPEDFTPHFHDGEVSAFLKISPEDVLHHLKEPNAVKPNSAMMILHDLYLSNQLKDANDIRFVQNQIIPLTMECDF